MKLNEYYSGDLVEVKFRNPQFDYKEEWREGKVIGVQTVFPKGQGGKPYPMVVIKFNRTYCKATPKYKYITGNVKRIKVFVDNTLEFYTKESTEGFLYEHEVRLIETFKSFKPN